MSEKALNRLSSHSIVDMLESDDEEIENIKKVDSDEEFVKIREPSPICVADLKKQQTEMSFLDDGEVKRTEEIPMEIPESSSTVSFQPEKPKYVFREAFKSNLLL